MSEHSKFCSRCDAQVSSKFSTCPFDGADLEDFSSDPLVGTLFDKKYEILKVLGKGGMSTVYRARHHILHRIVAVKIMREHLLTDDVAIERFKREALALSSLTHPNVVAVYESGVTPNNQAFIVMDPLEGVTLKHIIENDQRLSVKEAIPVFEQICDALQHIHQKGVLHRDLKPGNICLGKSERVKIVDFGFAKLLQHAAGARKQRELTRQGQVFGSPLYMSPEQCQGNDLDERADLYSLGCLMYEVLTGAPPFVCETAFDTMSAQVFDQPKSMRAIYSDPEAIPPQVDALVMKLLEKDPKRRYQSARELKEALHKLGEKDRRLFKALVAVTICLVLIVVAEIWRMSH